MKIKFFIILSYLLCSLGCSDNEPLQEKFNRFKNDDFSEFYNIGITWRYTCYIVDYKDTSYVIETNYFTKNISSIKRLQSYDTTINLSVQDKKQIEKAIKKFYKYKFQTLYVDKNKNVSLSFLWGRKCTYYFLKLSPTNTLKDIKMQDYQHYKDSWYVDKRCAE